VKGEVGEYRERLIDFLIAQGTLARMASRSPCASWAGFERTLFILSWLQSVDLRRRVRAGLNKGEAGNALARAVFLCRLGEIRDRSFEQQRYRASGLTLVTAAIALWNTIYIERAVQASARNGQTIASDLLKYLSPLGWEHINLTGDYQWERQEARSG
jgi:Tn3 transposase DDE domain